MQIPENAKNYTSSIPDIYVNNTKEYQSLTGTGIHNPVTIQQPTIYGGTSTPLFVVGQNQTAKSLASLDGKNIDAILGLPIIQLSLNLPIYSQSKFCAAYYNQGDVSLSFLRVGYNQRIDKLIKVCFMIKQWQLHCMDLLMKFQWHLVILLNLIFRHLLLEYMQVRKLINHL